MSTSQIQANTAVGDRSLLSEFLALLLATTSGCPVSGKRSRFLSVSSGPVRRQRAVDARGRPLVCRTRARSISLPPIGFICIVVKGQRKANTRSDRDRATACLPIGHEPGANPHGYIGNRIGTCYGRSAPPAMRQPHRRQPASRRGRDRRLDGSAAVDPGPPVLRRRRRRRITFSCWHGARAARQRGGLDVVLLGRST